MNPPEACDCVNRITLWATLYKAGLPTQEIQNIGQGRRITKLQRNDAGTYGGPIRSKVGASQGYALSALLFKIYLEDMIQDHQSLNGQMQLPKRYSAQPKEEIRTNQLLAYIARKANPETEAQLEETKQEQQFRNSTR